MWLIAKEKTKLLSIPSMACFMQAKWRIIESYSVALFLFFFYMGKNVGWIGSLLDPSKIWGGSSSYGNITLMEIFQKAGALWRCIKVAVMWMIWIERNNRIFEGKEEEKEWLWERIRFVAPLWASNSKPFKHYGVEYIKLNWKAIILWEKLSYASYFMKVFGCIWFFSRLSFGVCTGGGQLVPLIFVLIVWEFI